MILRKVSNLKPGDVIKLFDCNVQIKNMLALSRDRVEVSIKDGGTSIMYSDDFVEIVIL